MNRAIKLILSVFFLIGSMLPAPAQNPILPDFHADPSARVFNGKLYLYPSHDAPGATNWSRMVDWHAFSTGDLKTWTDHGVIFGLTNIAWAKKEAWAADCIERNGKFYFYFTAGGHIGVAVADSPSGSFKGALGEPLVRKGEADIRTMIDPNVFMDDDGQAYLYVGGSRQLGVVKLKPDMITRDGPVRVLEMPKFYEGVWVHKRNGIYYASYPTRPPSGQANVMVYSMAKSPFGPWEYKGELLDNRSHNVHGSITEFQGQWYLFYHVEGPSHWERRVCVERLSYNEDGTIKPVQMSKNAESINVLPVRDKDFTQSLNGDWSFKYIPALDPGADADFSKPAFDVSAWKKIPMPANWELQGFAEPQYALNLKNGLGLYRRTFRVPATWRDGRRVCLRFEGVAYGFEASVNGTKVGASSASCYNPHTFDITEALQSDSSTDNVLAVQVTTKPLGYEFDVNDDWALSGIYRDVTLFAVPATHFQGLATHTKITADGAADLTVNVTLSQPVGEIHGRLVAPNGELVSEFDLAQQTNGCHEAVVRVTRPQLWTAELPALYHLQLSLSAKGRLQTILERIGLREISIVGGVLRLNGRPIKLRGVNHHDISPEHGRAITEDEMRRDLELMKRGNINFVRTSHYPPNQRFIELCDELGFYVMDEVSIGKGEEHLNKKSHRENILARVEPTITRDKNRPSVIIWSIGNENPLTDVELEACRRAKELDPSRPVCLPKIGSYFEKNYASIPEYVDIYAPHYPGNATLRRYARSLKRPVILTEYAHALGLATDRIQDQWDILQATPQFAGGAIWMFQDQGLLRTSVKPVDRNQSTDVVWLDKNRYYDTHGNDGCDGIVYSDRTPQTDFWQTRKVYSPVQIAERAAAVESGAQSIAVTAENRHDFRALMGMKLAWSLQRNGAEIQQGELPLRALAREKEMVRVPVNIPADAAGDVLALNLRCVDETGQQITERAVRLNHPAARRGAWADNLAGAGKFTVSEGANELKIVNDRWELKVKRDTGALTIHDRSGRLLVAGIYPHPGRKLTMTEGRSAGRSGTWRASTLTKLDAPDIKVTQEGATVRLTVSGRYPRPQPQKENTEVKRSDEPLDQMDKPVQQQETEGEAFVGGYLADIAANGVIAIRYDYAPTQAKGMLSEAGLSVVLPAELTEFRWVGQGPYAGYPGKDRLNEFGIFHLNREDLHFQGNRRETELAVLTTAAGAGVALVTTPADVSVERDGDQTLLSHNAVISSLGNKGTTPETIVDAAKTPRITGSFTLVSLGEQWPEPLTRWFGKPAAAAKVNRPFHHSYDQ